MHGNKIQSIFTQILRPKIGRNNRVNNHQYCLNIQKNGTEFKWKKCMQLHNCLNEHKDMQMVQDGN